MGWVIINSVTGAPPKNESWKLEVETLSEYFCKGRKQLYSRKFVSLRIPCFFSSIALGTAAKA